MEHSKNCAKNTTRCLVNHLDGKCPGYDVACSCQTVEYIKKGNKIFVNGVFVKEPSKTEPEQNKAKCLSKECYLYDTEHEHTFTRGLSKETGEETEPKWEISSKQPLSFYILAERVAQQLKNEGIDVFNLNLIAGRIAILFSKTEEEAYQKGRGDMWDDMKGLNNNVVRP